MSDKVNIFATYFDSNIELLKLSSFWIYDGPTKSRKKYLQLIYNIFWSTYLYFIYLPCEILFVVFAFDDLDLFVRSLRDIGNHVALIYKAFNYYIFRRDILNLVDVLRTQECNYEDFEQFQPKLVVEMHKKEAVKWTTYFWYFVNGICLTMFASGLFIFVVQGDKQFIFEKGRRVYRQKPPVNILSPFGNDTRGQFLVTFFFTIFALTFYAWMIVALDSLFITLMSCLSAHLEILQGAFRTLRPRCLRRFGRTAADELPDSLEVQAEIQKEMVKCVTHLQVLYKVSEKLESVYHVQTFFQTFISLGEMCFSLYLMSQEFNENTGNEITYLIAVAFELLMHCWFGNRITEASIALSYSLYDSDWLPTNKSFRKQLLLTTTRMAKPIYVTIGKITPLTFHTFLTMVRGAYSFFTFLKQRDGILKK